jgi:pto-interacting protein 1
MAKTTSDDLLVMLVHQATPKLTEDRVQEYIDPKLGDQYPPAGALKVPDSSPDNSVTHELFLVVPEPNRQPGCPLQLGRIALQCLQYDPTFRPSMGTVARVINYAVLRDQQGVV